MEHRWNNVLCLSDIVIFKVNLKMASNFLNLNFFFFFFFFLQILPCSIKMDSDASRL